MHGHPTVVVARWRWTRQESAAAIVPAGIDDAGKGQTSVRGTTRMYSRCSFCACMDPNRPKRTAAPVATKAAPKKRKLSFKETTELTALPDKIDACEQERVGLYAQLADPALLRDGAAVAKAKARLAAIDADQARLMARWEALEEISAS